MRRAVALTVAWCAPFAAHAYNLSGTYWPDNKFPIAWKLDADGVTFRLNAVECGLASTGADFFDETPVGEWCRIDYTVQNDGSESVSLLGGDVRVFSGESIYHADDATGRFDEDYFTTDVNPGLSVPCIVFVDVPVGTALDRVAFQPVLSFAEPVVSATS